MKFLYATAALAALAASPIYAACTAPGATPVVPDATNATAKDILSSQKAVVAFDQATTTYLSCVKKEHDSAIAAAGPGITTVEADKIDRTADQQHDAAVKQLNSVVGRFNTLVKDFKQKQANAKAKQSKKKG